MAKLTYTGAEVQSLLDKVNGISGGGGGIAYPLSWSGYSQGIWDGSAPANIAIPSLLSQLTNDSNYITTESVNSLLTEYVQKSGLPVYGLRASSSVGKFYLQKDGVDVANTTLSKVASATNADSATLWSYNSPWVQDFDALNYSNNGLYHFDGSYLNLIGGPPHNAWNYSVLNMGSGSGRRQQVAIPYSTSRMFLRVNVDDNWSGWREFAFLDSTMYPTGDTAIQFPDGEYIDKWGNIVFSPTSGAWSVMDSNRNNKFVVWADGRVDTSNSLTVNGNILATGEVTQHSSLELKDVVDTRFLTLKELEKLKPYSFYWKDKRDDKLHAGAVADYVMPILPEVISTDKDNIHSMNYANAAWVVSTSLTPYVSKHEEEIAQLKARVRYLENKLKEC